MITASQNELHHLALFDMALKVLCALAASYLLGVSGLELSRYDAQNGFEEVPSDLGEYAFFTCKGEGDDRSCSFNESEMETYISVS